ncbi:hypothetical protein PYCC9005_000713 [Savitreella phatthalungensis]
MAFRTMIARSTFAASARRTPTLLATRAYATPSHQAESAAQSNEAGKKEAQKSEKQLNEQHNTASEAAVKGEKHNKSIDQLQAETAKKVRVVTRTGFGAMSS